MYYSIKSGGRQRIAEPTGQEEGLLGIFPYEKMLACGKKWGISAEILEEARRFSYARYDSFENFDCVSLEMLDFENILLSIGSVILYLEKGYCDGTAGGMSGGTGRKGDAEPRD